jgi:hypothetical protein
MQALFHASAHRLPKVLPELQLHQTHKVVEFSKLTESHLPSALRRLLALALDCRNDALGSARGWTSRRTLAAALLAVRAVGEALDFLVLLMSC